MGQLSLALVALGITPLNAQNVPPPVIDMHLHAEGAAEYGPPGGKMCLPYRPFPTRDPAKPIEEYLRDFTGDPKCSRFVQAPTSDDEIRDGSLSILERRNITAVTSGELKRVADWQAKSPRRIIPAVGNMSNLPSAAELRRLHQAGRLKVLGEILAQYEGKAPNDPSLEPYYALAEELDVPVGIHIGPGPPGVAYFAKPKYRAALGDPLLLEDVLVRHPKLRVYVMHAGYPFIDRMLALLYAHPQVYVDTGVISHTQSRAEFHSYIKRLVDAGFATRIMFGSDQMIWPETIEAAIESIESADFLSAEQKRDIFYNNAARFLRLPVSMVSTVSE